MRKPGDGDSEPEGGRAAERLREFLKKRLPPGTSPDELNPEAQSEDVGDEHKADPRKPAKKP